jgi:hypothetical protein
MAAGDVGVSITTVKGFPCNVFDGVDDYVEIPHNAAQLGANLSKGFTISAWINARSIGENKGQVFNKATNANGGDGFNIYMETTNRIKFNIKGTEHASGNNVVLYQQWYHILYTLSSANLCNLYINGVLTGTANQDLSAGGGIAGITTTNAMRIGNRAGGTDFTFDGSIREVKMWNRVLSTTEIAQDYAGTTPATENLIHNFKLGGDYADYGSVGVTATNSGSLSQVVEGDTTSTAIKALRTLTGISGVYMITRGEGGQVVSTGIQNT